jgi:glycosyltransferase involved in cell wall biosynthesis
LDGFDCILKNIISCILFSQGVVGMRIGISAIHVIPGKSGSHEPYVVNLIDALSRLDTLHQITLFVTQANEHLFEGARQKMEMVVYPEVAANGLVRILFEQIKLPMDAWDRKLDILHYPGNAASIFVRSSDVVTIHFDHFTQRTSLSPLHIFYYNLVFRINKRAGRLIVPSRAYGDDLLKLFLFEPERISVVHHGVGSSFRQVSESDIDTAKNNYHLEDNAILTVTNTLPHKNIPNLLAAFEILLTQYKCDNQLVMVGNLNREHLVNLIGKIASDPAKMQARMRVIPFLPHEMLPSIYAASGLFVFYSWIETFGMPIVEALACGLPVLASDIPVHAEILGDGGELVPPDQPALLAAKIHRLIVDKNYRETMKVKALNRSRHFSWEKTAMQTLQVYEVACSKKI